MGVTAFLRNNSRMGTNSDCIYRICQDGVQSVLPYMQKRVIRSKDKSIFNKFIMARFSGWRSACEHNKEVLDQIDDLTVGCFVFVLELDDGNVEPLSMHKFEDTLGAVSTMISKDNAYSL